MCQNSERRYYKAKVVNDLEGNNGTVLSRAFPATKHRPNKILSGYRPGEVVERRQLF